MKAVLEAAAIPGRGVILTGETAEENRLLLALFTERGRPQMLHRVTGDNIELIIAPHKYETAVTGPAETRG